MRILVVEADEQLRKLIRDVAPIIIQGAEVVTAENGEVAIAKMTGLVTDCKPPDVVISDYCMPGHTNGMTVLNAAAIRFPGVGLILMSGGMAHVRQMSPIIEKEADRAKDIYPLLKPFDLWTLIETICRAARVEPPATPKPPEA